MKNLKEVLRKIDWHNRTIRGHQLLMCFSRDSWQRQTLNLTTAHARMYVNATVFSTLRTGGACGRGIQTVVVGYKSEYEASKFGRFLTYTQLDLFSLAVVEKRGFKLCTFYVYGDKDSVIKHVYVLGVSNKGWQITRHALPLFVGESMEGTIEHRARWDGG